MSPARRTKVIRLNLFDGVVTRSPSIYEGDDMKGDKPPCKAKDCQHSALKHATGGGCMMCGCTAYKS